MNRLHTLNPMQQEAVLHTEGPLLILAGAGSGKTRALTHRVAYLIEEKGVAPWNILAITFTNKAAGEMRERVNSLVEYGADSVLVSTFHSLCVRILRRFIENLGYDSSFSIYDTDDQKTLMKQIFKNLDVNTKQYKERGVLGIISAAKNELIGPDEFALNARISGTFRDQKIAELYREYQTQLKKNNALDFDDLLVKTVELFDNNPEILDYYQEKFRYIMVDEYQDTNTAQFRLVSQLAKKYGNICVVGDDDQSIYSFRGANIRNILNFEETFPGARVIKLEQNYRSTRTILNAANGVIRNNSGRKDKTLWTENPEGSRVRVKIFDTAYDEADGIVKDMIKQGGSWKDYAVLYRTNAQSRIIEEKCIAYNVPYRLVGGVNFYQRKEIKDILAYLKTIANGRDDLAVQRIINVPKRGIGATTVGKINLFAMEHDMNFYDTLLRIAAVPGIGKTAAKIDKFTDEIGRFRRMLRDGESIQDVIEEILSSTGYKEELQEEGEVEAETRLQNIDELVSKAVSYWEDADEPSLDGFLEEVALVADIDSMDESEDRVILMTLHAAKGLEFPRVYLTGMEEGLFPSMMAMQENPESLEEERRLCYVGITRAEQELMLTAARQRMIKGETRYEKPSRFLQELPEEFVERLEQENSIYTRRRVQSEYEDSDLPWNNRSEGISLFGQKSSAYASKTVKPAPEKPSYGSVYKIQKSSTLDYGPGDRVNHMRFGNGTVKSIVDGGKDYEVTVEFDTMGVRKMFASFAKLKKV
ncbi:MAG: UvrD-helicase domain-containing protein [Lachnospiraceae bacterium]|nr:UvrD-helicase domain-containing protein [Lachnospiraceae bacterium]